MKPIPMVFHLRPDFDVAKSPHATLFAKFVGRKKTPPHGEASQRNPYWKLVHWFLHDKPSLEISELAFV